MANEYVEQSSGEFMLAGSRVTLASIITAWKEGLSAESIRDEFPVLSLEQVYGAITYYLRNQVEIDSYLAALASDFDHRARQQAALYPEITSRLRAAKETAQR
ncbi:MAG TPA: DUF433 domain-containing protein [Bryobacteraceae bacterium]